MNPFDKEKAALAGAAHKNNLQHQSYRSRRHRQANYVVIQKRDYIRLNQAALCQLPRLLAMLGIQYREERHELVMLNPRRLDTRYGSFRVNRSTGRWADFALTGVSGGDAVSLVAYLRQVQQGEAAQWIQRGLGVRHDRA